MDEAEEVQHSRPLVNQSPEALKHVYTLAVWFLQSYGWYLVFGLVALLYFKNRFSQTFSKVTSSFRASTDEHKYDNDAAFRRQEAIEAARRRLQEQMDAQAARYAEEMKKKEEEKRAQKLEDWERYQEGKGYRSKYRPPEETTSAATGPSSSASKKKSTLRPADYNPLVGGGTGSTYRPERRTLGGGG
jgi:selenoprotein S